MAIETAFDGRLGGPQLIRTSVKGKRWMSISLAVDTGSERPEWISVALFGDVMESLPEDLCKGERVYVEGRLKVNRYTGKDGVERSNLQVSATRALLLDRIGRRAKRRKVQAAQSNVFPFDEPASDFGDAA